MFLNKATNMYKYTQPDSMENSRYNYYEQTIIYNIYSYTLYSKIDWIYFVVTVSEPRISLNVSIEKTQACHNFHEALLYIIGMSPIDGLVLMWHIPTEFSSVQSQSESQSRFCICRVSASRYQEQ